jgi:hypothetical protein
MIDGFITLIICTWVLMAVLAIPPFKSQQASFLRFINKKVWLVFLSITFIGAVFQIVQAY